MGWVDLSGPQAAASLCENIRTSMYAVQYTHITANVPEPTHLAELFHKGIEDLLSFNPDLAHRFHDQHHHRHLDFFRIPALTPSPSKNALAVA